MWTRTPSKEEEDTLNLRRRKLHFPHQEIVNSSDQIKSNKITLSPLGSITIPISKCLEDTFEDITSLQIATPVIKFKREWAIRHFKLIGPDSRYGKMLEHGLSIEASRLQE